MAMQWARALADASRQLAHPSISTLVNVEKVGDVLVEVLQRLDQLLESQQQMYAEYLELKKRQVQLLERTTSQHARAD
jgi:Na+/phosphate symporter